MVTVKRAKGDAAEDLAKSWLESQGYTALETNFNRRIGEIDLIMQGPGGSPIVFVEVRYRHNQTLGGALESVNFRKQNKIRRTAVAWLQMNADSRAEARIDVIAVSPAQPDTPAEQFWQGHRMVWIVNAIEG